MLAILTAFVSVSAQNPETGNKSSGKKFYFGLSYSYLKTDLVLLSMTKESVWAGDDFGVLEVDQEEIDNLNSFVEFSDQFDEGILTAGMALLDKPGNPLNIKGMVTLGFGKRQHSVFNTNTDETEMKYNSKIHSPSVGVSFDFHYKLTDHWMIGLQASTLYLFGKTDNVDDNIYPVVGSMEEERENTFDLSYSRFNLLGSYVLNDFTFSMGPGFYLLYNWNKYEIIRTSQATGQTFEDTIKSKLRNTNFINGTARIDWRASEHFLINAAAGISKDITATAGIFYLL